jgi:23S rRNA pseudouridine1911/1915/1917 synthase
MTPDSSTPDHSRGLPIRRRVTPADGVVRLDVYLAGQPEVPSRTAAKWLIQHRQVRVGDRAGKPGQYLEPGNEVSFDPVIAVEIGPRPAAEAAPLAPAVLHEDASILVIVKPAGLVAHPATQGAGGRQPSVSAWAARRCPGLPAVAGADRPGIVHRLDKETSGVMVLAKTEDAFHFLKGEFKARRVVKEYRAIAYGEARFQSDFIHRSIAPHPHKGDRMTVVKEGGRPASTYYEVVERFAGFTHFACFPKTGRTHQIRVHLTSIGHGLVGDRFYRARNQASAALPAAAPDPGRHCLHALRLGFAHPFTRAAVEFAAPLPGEVEDLLGWLRAHRSK